MAEINLGGTAGVKLLSLHEEVDRAFFMATNRNAVKTGQERKMTYD